MKKVSLRYVFRTWWPLAMSWLLMGSELPALSAVVARLEAPKIHLAAYGGVVFPLSLIIEAPIIMLLAASTALSRDWASYRKLRRFMMWAGFLLTALHFALAFTPLYYPLVVGLMGVPAEIVEPARIGLMIMIPWTWSIAYRRFHQGVLIRFGHSKVVGSGTVIRLMTDGVVLALGYLRGDIPGIVVATSAVAAGVIAEAVYVGIRVRPVLRDELRPAAEVTPALTWRSFYDFYIPLAMTSLLLLVVQPMGSAALSRMPFPLESLAVWPVLGGFMFMLRSLGFAYNEVVVALLDEPGSVYNLRRFMWILFFTTTGALTLLAATPLSRFWFENVSGLPPELSRLAMKGLWVALLWPGLSVMLNWFQGAIVNGRKTRGVTEAVVAFLLVAAAILVAGAWMGKIVGLYVGLAAFVGGTLVQVLWLWLRSTPIIRRAEQRDRSALQPSHTPAVAD